MEVIMQVTQNIRQLDTYPQESWELTAIMSGKVSCSQVIDYFAVEKLSSVPEPWKYELWEEHIFNKE